MKIEGPQIDVLTHRLAECPAEFLETPRRGDSGTIDVSAIVADHLRELGETELSDVTKSIRGYGVRRQQLIAITAWLLNHSWFLRQPQLGKAMQELCVSNELGGLSQTIRPESTVTDPDRREELARVCLRGLGMRPQGESVTEATDRLNTLDSVERDRVVRQTRAAEARARKIREEMATRAAQEAAARYSRE